jgi:hypothetical protein
MQKIGKGSGLFQLIDRKAFDRLVKKWDMDKWVRGLSTKELTCALLNALIMQLGSYREVEEAMGIPRSTLGDALSKRYAGFFVDLCDEVLLVIRAKTRSRKIKKAVREIMAIDSSDIRVHGSLFTSSGWKQKKAKGNKAAAKFHCVWSVDGEWIENFSVTGGRTGDSPASFFLSLRPGCTYVFDRAYNDVKFWLKITKAGSHFVTRLKAMSIKNLAAGKKAELKKKTVCSTTAFISPVWAF